MIKYVPFILLKGIGISIFFNLVLILLYYQILVDECNHLALMYYTLTCL